MSTELDMEASTTGINNEASTEIMINSQLDDLLAAYDMHELTTKMAAVVENCQEEGSSLEERKEEEVVTTLAKEEENGDHVAASNAVYAKQDESTVEELSTEMNEPPKPVVVKSKRDRRKRPPNKSILKPTHVPDSSPLFHTPNQVVTTTENMIQAIPDMFRIMSTTPTPHSPNSNVQRRTGKEPRCANGNMGVMDQIQQAVLPVYASLGPPSRLQLPFFENGYVCPDCSDRFWLESSFAQHVQRRSVYINFFCHVCCTILIFYNRCALLGHARIHRERQQACDVSSATLAPLEKELIPCVQEAKLTSTNIGVLSSGEKTENRAQKRKRKDNSSPVSSKSTSEAAKYTGTVFVPKTTSQSCSECQHVCKDHIELAEHFGENREAPPNTDSECPQCHTICTSRCSLSSHQRMHAKTRPFVCPECGQKVSELWHEFKNHVTESCMHHSRMLGFRCPACGVLSVNPEHLKSHVSNDHKVVLYKCESCPKAFKSARSFEGHRRSVHSENHPPTTYTTIQQCPLCDFVIHQQNLIAKHLDIHFQEIFAAAKYVFRCLECGRLSESKTDLSEHLKNSHLYLTVSEKKQHVKPQKKKSKPSSSSPAAADHGVGSPAPCDRCTRVFRTHLGLNVHRFRSHGIRINHGQTSSTREQTPPVTQPPITIKFKKKKKSNSVNSCNNYTLSSSLQESSTTINGELTHFGDGGDDDDDMPKCKLCYDEFPSVKALVEHGYLHIQEGFLICMLCSNCTFTNKIALSKHLEKHSLSSNYPISCIYCQETLTHRTQAAVHWREEHGLSSFQCPHCETRYLYHKSLSRHIREVHRGQKKWKKKVPLTPRSRASPLTHVPFSPDLDHEEREKSKQTLLTGSFESKADDGDVDSLVEQSNCADSGEEKVPEGDTDNTEPDVNNVEFDFSLKEERGDYRCAKCEFESHTRPVFLRHISQHKSELDEALQCLECGTSFVVEPSLHKHLKVVHKIKNLESYLSMIKAEDAEGLDRDSCANNNNFLSREQNGGGGAAIELKCSICHSLFENEQMLKTHSRSHGMAFLQAASKRSLCDCGSDTSPSSTPTKVNVNVT